MIRHILVSESDTVLRTMLIAGALADAAPAAAGASRGGGMTRLLLVATVLVVVLAAAGVGAGTEWDVYPGAGTPIQDAVDGAGEGDTIYVHAGTYVENVDVGKRVTLIGDGADVVTVRAADAEDNVFEVTADWVNILGFTVAGASDGTAGIYLNGADHCNISDNTASNNCRGIYLHHYSSNNVLIENNVSDNNHGIDLRHYSSNNVLIENNVSDNKYSGIDLSESNHNTLTENNCSNNDYGIHLYYYSSHNTLTENYCCSNNYHGILACLSSNYNTFTDNTANSNNGDGVYLSSLSNYNTLTGNTASDNNYGIYLYRSSSNTLTENNCCSNNYHGIYLRDSSDNNALYHNNLINNTDHDAYDTGTNQWDSGAEGNYYSNYTGTDPDGDGIGNDPYPIPGGESIDRFPLMQPWTYAPPQKGDLNGDDRITPADAAIALQLAASGSASCDAATRTAADVSGDGQVTSLDALMILKAAAGGIAL